ncbi:hypothetical protein [Flavobacterium sp.]|uniref:hypothetical protein n=1 Tax=Flavobacterium sp. TaxID=239 RepID=UPI00261C6FD7|nr:hypothetical protein [Flavobacterium sp.]
MSQPDFDFFRQKYAANCTTQSDNPAVLAVYRIVLEGEHKDSDYWSEEHGTTAILSVFEHCFTALEWSAQEADLKNWTTSQLELFTEAIMGGYLSYTHNGVYYDHYAIDDLTKTVPNRIALLLAILTIERERGLQYRELSGIVLENCNFINDHFEILLKQDVQNIIIIQEIFKSVAVFDPTGPTIMALKNKIDNVNI